MSTRQPHSDPEPSAPSPWQRLPELARAFALCDQQLEVAFGRGGVPPELRALSLARLGWRLVQADMVRSGDAPGPASARELPAETLEALRRAWRDPRVAGLHPNQRAGLLFVTGTALALRLRDEGEAEALLTQALSLALATSCPAEWSPLEGPRPEPVPRLPLAFRMTAAEDSSLLAPAAADEADSAFADTFADDFADPTGDPVGLPARAQLEAPAPGMDLPNPVPMAQILDGLHAWGAVLQTCLGWPEGDMARLGRPRLETWGKPGWIDPSDSSADPSFRRFAHLLAGAQNAA